MISIIAMAIFKEKDLRYDRISSIILLYAGALALNALYIQPIGSGIGIYGGLFQITAISQFFDLFIYSIGAMILIAWPSSISRYGIRDPISLIADSKEEIKLTDEAKGLNSTKIRFNTISSQIDYMTEYSLIALFSTFGASLLISSADFVSTYLSIELQSFGVYILASLYRDSESATSAGLKYFLLGGLSSCMILLGIGLIYSYTGLTRFESLYNLISVSSDDGIVRSAVLGLSLMIIGFLFKIAAAPLHNWAPDVYDDSPTIVTIWLTIMPKISIMIFLLELNVYGNILSTINNDSIDVIKSLLLVSSSLSLLLGTIVGLSQIKIKRLLAYSTISHVGFILLALAISTEQSIESMIFYIIQYTFTNLNTFLIIIALSYVIHDSMIADISNESTKTKTNEYRSFGNYDISFISELKNQFASNPLLSLGLSISLFSMAGIPPLIGFFSKQFVLSSAIQDGYYFMAIIAIIVSVISASYYLKIVRVLHTSIEYPYINRHEDSNESSLRSKTSLGRMTNIHGFSISIFTSLILFFVLKPSILLSSIRILSLSIFYC